MYYFINIADHPLSVPSLFFLEGKKQRGSNNNVDKVIHTVQLHQAEKNNGILTIQVFFLHFHNGVFCLLSE